VGQADQGGVTVSALDAPFKVGDRIRYIGERFRGDEPTCVAVTDTHATFDLQWGEQPFWYWRRPEYWEQIAYAIDRTPPAKVMPTPPVTVADVTRLIAAWHDSQARGSVSRDFAACLSDLAARCGLPVPEFRGVLDGVPDEAIDVSAIPYEDLPTHDDAPDAVGQDTCSVDHSGWGCTRPPGHEGDHVARGGGKRAYARWPQ
jgi:hypothetical protein